MLSRVNKIPTMNNYSGYQAKPRMARAYAFELTNGNRITIVAESYQEAVMRLRGYKKLKGYA